MRRADSDEQNVVTVRLAGMLNVILSKKTFEGANFICGKTIIITIIQGKSAKRKFSVLRRNRDIWKRPPWNGCSRKIMSILRKPKAMAKQHDEILGASAASAAFHFIITNKHKYARPEQTPWTYNKKAGRAIDLHRSFRLSSAEPFSCAVGSFRICQRSKESRKKWARLDWRLTATRN